MTRVYGNPLDGAARMGARARSQGKPESANPYDGGPNEKGRCTWSRAFYNAWIAGYRGTYQPTTVPKT